jgi:hypothetical protein
MSEAKNKFYEILVPKIEAFGFEYKKSKTTFTKIENGIEYQISFHWDGRGGTTMMNAIGASVIDIAIQQTMTKRKKEPGFPHVVSNWGYCATNSGQIPVMYSRALLELANNMNFKAMSKMPQDDKYPPERILNSAKFVEDLIVNQVFPFFKKYKNTSDIYEYWRERIEKDPDSVHFNDYIKEMLKEFSLKSGLPEMQEPPQKQI